MTCYKVSMRKKCINCGKQPIVNIQKLWVKWKYDAKNDDYSSKCEVLDIEPDINDSLHLCDNCVELWEQGGL